MLKQLMQLFSEDGTVDSSRNLSDTETSHAAAALLVHAARIDGDWDPAEDLKLKDLLKERFSLEENQLRELLDDAEKADNEAVDLYQFTSVLTRNLDQDGRKNIIEMLWAVANADGIIHEFEDNLVWRVAELLGVSTRDRMLLKKKVTSGTAAGNGDNGNGGAGGGGSGGGA